MSAVFGEKLGVVENNELTRQTGLLYAIGDKGDKWRFELVPLGALYPVLREKYVEGRFRDVDHMLEAIRAFMKAENAKPETA